MKSKRGIELGLLIVIVLLLMPIVTAPPFPAQTCEIQIARDTPDNFVKGGFGAVDIKGRSDGWTNVPSSSTCGIGCLNVDGSLKEECAPHGDYYISLNKDLERGEDECGACSGDSIGPIYQGSVNQGKNNGAGESQLGGLNPEWSEHGPFDLSSSDEWTVVLYDQSINNVNYPSYTCGSGSPERSLGTTRITLRSGESISQRLTSIDGLNFDFRYAGGDTLRFEGTRVGHTWECHIYFAKFVIFPSDSGMCFNGKKLSSCKIGTDYNTEDYPLRCAASVDNDLDGQPDNNLDIGSDVYLSGADAGSRCCGNFQDRLEDNGNYYGPADKLCTRRDDGVNGDWKWLGSIEDGVPFLVYDIFRGNDRNRYSALSNGDGWYFCPTAAGTGMAPFSSDERMIEEYSGIPIPTTDLGDTGSRPRPDDDDERLGTTLDDFDPGGGSRGEVSDTNLDGDDYHTGAGLDDPDCEDRPFGEDGIPNTIDDGINIFPGAPDPCETRGVEIDQACNDVGDSVLCTPVRESIGSDRARAARFMCYNEENRGIFAECCNGIQCNNEAPVARSVGSVLTSLKEYYEDCSMRTNCVFPWEWPENNDNTFYFHTIFTDPSVPVSNTILRSDSPIRDWSGYEFVEMYIYVSNSFIGELRFLGPRNNLGDGDGTTLQDYTVLETERINIKDYVINTPALRKWMHVKVPLSKLISRNEVNGIVFYADNAEVQSFGNANNGLYNTVGIDRVVLTTEGEEHYCSGSFLADDVQQLWIEDLDDARVGGDNEPVGRQACDQTPGYGWTGTQCCGDDTTREFKEVYADTFAGCAAGNVLHENDIAGFVEYTTTRNGQQTYHTQLCTSEECEYPIPGSDTRETSVMNPHPLLYDLRFVAGTEDADDDTSNIIVDQDTPNDAVASLRAEKVPRQLLYFHDKFHGCNAEEYVYEDIPVDGFENLEECSTVSRFFCSTPANGIRASHWSDENAGTAEAFERNTSYTLPGTGSDQRLFFATEIEGFSSTGCCSPDTCWNGGTCVEGVAETITLDGPGAGTIYDLQTESFTTEFGITRDGFDQYVCLLDEEGASWRETFYKEQWDNSSQGYCVSDNSCWNGEECVVTGFVAGDNYCEDGNWSSRTKFLGQKFIELVKDKDEYVLYCDNYTNALNHVNYEPAFGFLEGDAVQQAGANNFCVLQYPEVVGSVDTVVIGTSINDVDARMTTMLNILEVDNCGNEDRLGSVEWNNGEFHTCNLGDNHLWVNNKMGLVVYAKDGPGLLNFGALDGVETFLNFIRYPIEQIIDIIVSIVRPVRQDAVFDLLPVERDFFMGLQDFNTIYVAKQLDKHVLGLQERFDGGDGFLTVEYRGFFSDICSKNQNDFVSCQPLFTVDQLPRYSMTSFHPLGFGVWRDVTAKLRFHEVDPVVGTPLASINQPEDFTPSESPFTTASVIRLGANTGGQNAQAYYWDLSASEPRNGERRGAIVENIRFREPGFHTIDLMALGFDGTWTTDSRTICVNDVNDDSPDIDNDGILNGCDNDDDGDFVLDSGDGDFIEGNNLCQHQNAAHCDDNCKDVPNPDQSDVNNDGVGDACSEDADGDGRTDTLDAFPLDAEVKEDFDNDGLPDTFNDGFVNENAEHWADCDIVGHPDRPCLDQDDDADGLLDRREDLGCRLNPDCDGDGLLDNEKMVDPENGLFGSSALHRDTDGDGLSDCQEVKHTIVEECENSDYRGPFDGGYLTNPTLIDTDDDGFLTESLSDYREIVELRSDPTNADSDGDSMIDGWEVFYGLNLNSASDATGDIEPDGLQNRDEHATGTDPRNADTDNDGFTDGFEVSNGRNPLIQDPLIISLISPEQGSTVVELSQFVIHTDKQATCKFSRTNKPFDQMVARFDASANGLEHTAAAVIQSGVNSVFIHCKDSFNIVTPNALFLQFTYDDIDISITSTEPAGTIFTLEPDFILRTTREADCTYADSEVFLFDDGEPLSSTDRRRHSLDDVSIRDKVNTQISLCETGASNVDLLSCRAAVSQDISVCSDPVIVAAGLTNSCTDTVHYVAALSSRNIQRCGSILDPKTRTDCQTFVNSPDASYPFDGLQYCASEPSSTIRSCFERVGIANAIRLQQKTHCLDQEWCDAILSSNVNTCVNAACDNVFDHQYTFGVLCEDDYDRLSPPGKIQFQLRDDLDVSES